MEAENPEEAADFFRMDRQYSLLNETIYFERYPSVDPGTETLEEGFYDKYDFLSVCAWYLSHPDSLMRMLSEAAQEGYMIRPDMLGNYDRSAGKPPGAKTNFFTAYSTLKRRVVPTTVGFVLVWMLVITGLNFHDKQKLLLLWCAIAAGLIQVGTSIVGAGDTDLSKHVFLYNVAFDLVTFISISPLIVRLAQWLFHILKRKKNTACIFLMIMAPLALSFDSNAAQGQDLAELKEKVLIVCHADTDAAFLQEMVETFGREADVVSEYSYVKGQALIYGFVITTSQICMNELQGGSIPALCLKDACSPGDVQLSGKTNSGVALSFEEWSEAPQVEVHVSYLSEAGELNMGELKIGEEIDAPFLKRSGNLMYVPWYREGGLGAVMMGNAVAALLGDEREGAMYVAIDEVYPFSELGRLCEMADILYDNGIPFIVRVMPVYENLDYPAFLRYAQVLRYVQAKNGTIMLHPPLVREAEEETEPLEARMKRFTDALETHDIFYVSEENAPFQMEWEELLSIQANGKNFGVFPFPCMFTIPADSSMEFFEDTVKQINGKWLSLSDYKAEFTDESFGYREEPVQEDYLVEEETEPVVFENFFEKGDRILLLVVGFGLIIFLILIGIGAKWYRRKFLHDSGDAGPNR